MEKTPFRVPWRQTLTFSLVISVIASIIAVVWPARGVHSAPGWTTPQLLSVGATLAVYSPEMVIDAQGYTHAVWWGNGVPDDQRQVYYSNNRGGSWATPKTISPTGDERSPMIAIAPSGELDVVYEDYPDGEIMHTYSTDYGATWSPRQNISNSPGKGYEPCIAADADGNMHAVWIDNRWGNYRITYAKRTGTTWGNPVLVHSDDTFDKTPRVTTTGSGADMRVHVAFYARPSSSNEDQDYEAYYVRGTGSTWEPMVNVSRSPGFASLTPDIASGNGGLYYVWDEKPVGSYHDIFMTFSVDNGGTWATAIPITYDPALSRAPSVAFGQSLVHISYDSNDVGSGDAFYVVYNPAAGQLLPRVNLSQSGGESAEVDLAVDSCHISAAWQEKLSTKVIYYSTSPAIPPGPCGVVPTTVPTTPPTPLPTTIPPTIAPTADPRPHGYVDIVAQQPLNDHDHTSTLVVNLVLSATASFGKQIADMRIDNYADFHGNPYWTSFAPALNNWNLLPAASGCENKLVYAQFRDNAVPPNESIVVSDHILYDNYLVAAMALNEGKAYTNRTMVMVNTTDLDEQAGCSGLAEMAIWEEGLTQTVWVNFYPRIYFFLAPLGNPVRTVHASYIDHAGNQGSYSDSIELDITPPYSGTSPVVNNGVPADHDLVVPVSNMSARDSQSGMGYIRIANRAEGPWFIQPYCSTPPCTVNNWNLGYGGPPRPAPELHYVYVQYEDNAGYGTIPGNLSPIYQGIILVSGISNVSLPIILKGADQEMQAQAPSAPAQLLLVADPLQDGSGQDVLLYLAARREQPGSATGTLRLQLPEGLQVLKAWSMYGDLLEVSDHQVISRETASPYLTPWIMVHARVVGQTQQVLSIQGDMQWAGGVLEAPELLLNMR